MPGYTTVGENGEVISKPIKPFRKLLPERLPKKIANTFKLHWKPIYTMMEHGLQPNVLDNNPSTELTDLLFAEATESLKTRVSYIFEDNKLHHNNWTLSTWSKYIGRNHILKRGNANDIANLPEETRFNQGHTGRKRQVPHKQNARATRRERFNPRSAAVPPQNATFTPTEASQHDTDELPHSSSSSDTNNSDNDDHSISDNGRDTDFDKRGRSDNNRHAGRRVLQRRQQQERGEQSDALDNHFATAFGLTTSDLSEAAQVRARQYEQQVQHEVQQELADERGRRRVGGVATAADGSTLFVRSVGHNRNANDRGYDDWLASALPNDNSNEY